MLRRFWRDMVDSREAVETRKALREVAPYTLAALPEGTFGRVVGTCVALDGTRLVAPFSERECFAYILTTDGQTAPFHERLAIPFRLEQRGASAIVEPRNAMVSLSRTTLRASKRFSSPTRKQRELLDQIVGGDIANPDAVTFIEAVIAEGDELVVGAFGVRETDLPANQQANSERTTHADPYRGTPTRVRLIGAAHQPILIANDRVLVE
ncbi:MAG: hypothetical protein H0T79_15340 [Deltaproteobacteria bacterium]|nr:hypothetical protein [Deltaproteobacteria bacterium]